MAAGPVGAVASRLATGRQDGDHGSRASWGISSPQGCTLWVKAAEGARHVLGQGQKADRARAIHRVPRLEAFRMEAVLAGRHPDGLTGFVVCGPMGGFACEGARASACSNRRFAQNI